MNDLKQQILHEIESNVSVFKQVNSIQYRIRCPICGDSQKNPNDAHCYIKCSNDPTEPLLYICFKCNSSGVVGKYFLSRLGLPERVINMVTNQKYNKIGSTKVKDVNIITGTPIMDSPQVRYIEERLGKGFTYDDLDKFKIIWDMKSLYDYVPNQRVKNTLPNNYDTISFLSDDKSMVLSRTFEEGKESQWRKIKLFNSPKSFYTIKVTLDLFTRDPIIVNIAEGIFDILSVYKNFSTQNDVYIATLGSDYVSAIDYAISKGFVGSNVMVKVYIDNGIDERSLKEHLKRYRWMFNSIHVYGNLKSKDVGVPIDKIYLNGYKI